MYVAKVFHIKNFELFELESHLKRFRRFLDFRNFKIIFFNMSGTPANTLEYSFAFHPEYWILIVILMIKIQTFKFSSQDFSVPVFL